MIESCLTYIDINQVNLRRQNTETPSQGPWNIYKWILYNYPGLWAIVTHRQQSVSFQDGCNPFIDEKLQMWPKENIARLCVPGTGNPCLPLQWLWNSLSLLSVLQELCQAFLLTQKPTLYSGKEKWDTEAKRIPIRVGKLQPWGKSGLQTVFMWSTN